MVDMGSLVGSIRRFGLVGPSYEVLGPASLQEEHGARMRIRLVESGEETDYSLAQLLADPEED